MKRSKDDKVAGQRLLECILCFRRNTFSAADILGLAECNPLFSADLIELHGEPIPFTEKEKTKLLGMNQAQGETAAAKGIRFLNHAQTEALQFLYPPHPSKPQVMHWVFAAGNNDALSGSWLRSLLANDHFTVGYCGDKEDMFMQSSTVYQLYEKKGIKPAKTIRNEFGDIVVDVTHNPGRRKLVKNMWLMSCWKMWFGNNFYPVVEKERIQSFPGAYAIEALDNNVISVELYPDPFKAASPDNRAIQKAFREWVDMDRLEQDLA